MPKGNMEEEEILEAKIEKAEYEGWTIIEEKKHTVLLEKKSFGSLKMHILILILTVWWSLGAVNILYAIYKYLSPQS